MEQLLDRMAAMESAMHQMQRRWGGTTMKAPASTSCTATASPGAPSRPSAPILPGPITSRGWLQRPPGTSSFPFCKRLSRQPRGSDLTGCPPTSPLEGTSALPGP